MTMFISSAMAAEASGHGPGAEPFYASPEFWIFAVFVVLAVLAVPPLKRGIKVALAVRAEKIRKSFDETRNLRDEAQAVLLSYQKKNKEVAKDIEAINLRMKNDAAFFRAEAEENMSRAVKGRQALLKERMQQDEETLDQELKDYLITLSMGAALKLLKEGAADNASAAFESALAELPARLVEGNAVRH